MRNLRIVVACLLFCLPVCAQTYEVVIRGGRVLDPETGLDAVRDVGIAGGKIARISEAPSIGAMTV
jgi:N-acyl-D-glutamate deacylase